MDAAPLGTGTSTAKGAKVGPLAFRKVPNSFILQFFAFIFKVITPIHSNGAGVSRGYLLPLSPFGLHYSFGNKC